MLDRLYRSTVDGEVQGIDEFIERYQLQKPEWHRGIVWPVEVQQRFVRSWLAGEVRLQLAIGELITDRSLLDTQPHFFLDGLNSFHAVRLACAGQLDIEVPVKRLPWDVRFFKCFKYRSANAAELEHATYLLNRGSPLPWTKQQLSALSRG